MGFAAALLAALATGATAAAPDRCGALKSIAIRDGSVVAATLVPAAFEASARATSSGPRGFSLPQSCRVRLVLAPSRDSHIETQVWLPTTAWNGRLQGIGNGGYSGSIDLRSMQVALKYGYVAAATDTGHRSTADDASWALGHPERLEDTGWRAIHETAQVAKLLIAAFYGRPVQHAYFSGGSNGGRQALVEAQRFPQDYDGVAAGAPALDPANNLAFGAWIEHRLLLNPAGFIPDSKAPFIAAAALKACDAIDGVADGVIDNPDACRFDPNSLACADQAGVAGDHDCLTAAQVAWLRDIYDGPGGPYQGQRNGGLARGGESGWTPIWLGRTPQETLGPVLSLGFYRDVVYGDPSWNLARFAFAKDRPAGALRAREAHFDAQNPDLSRFAARGGKLILYQGWSDPLVPPHITIDYFEEVEGRMGPASAARFLRLYMAPGMGHVTGGTGPDVFGQLAPGAASDPLHSINAALEQWVEKGVPPAAIIAGKYANEERAQLERADQRPLRERPLCPYPQITRWVGHGDTDDVRNFSCVDAAAASNISRGD
ncbi:MAG TPA: tannase/feruloyl esterase family alpha/beta hydrolase [Caulobacteraceae bacterium]|nr:tannase/feruloyl esterase family alpha/beta hydrolase [Caulobacteraceae bacterium]